MSEIVYNPQKLTQELKEAGLPVVGVSSAGRIDFARKLTAAEEQAFTTIKAAHDPAPSAETARREAFAAAGVTLEMMVFALWDQIINGDSSGIAALEAKLKAAETDAA